MAMRATDSRSKAKSLFKSALRRLYESNPRNNLDKRTIQALMKWDCGSGDIRHVKELQKKSAGVFLLRGTGFKCLGIRPSKSIKRYEISVCSWVRDSIWVDKYFELFARQILRGNTLVLSRYEYPIPELYCGNGRPHVPYLYATEHRCLYDKKDSINKELIRVCRAYQRDAETWGFHYKLFVKDGKTGKYEYFELDKQKTKRKPLIVRKSKVQPKQGENKPEKSRRIDAKPIAREQQFKAVDDEVARQVPSAISQIEAKTQRDVGRPTAANKGGNQPKKKDMPCINF